MNTEYRKSKRYISDLASKHYIILVIPTSSAPRAQSLLSLSLAILGRVRSQSAWIIGPQLVQETNRDPSGWDSDPHQCYVGKQLIAQSRLCATSFWILAFPVTVDS